MHMNGQHVHDQAQTVFLVPSLGTRNFLLLLMDRGFSREGLAVEFQGSTGVTSMLSMEPTTTVIAESSMIRMTVMLTWALSQGSPSWPEHQPPFSYSNQRNMCGHHGGTVTRQDI